MKQSLLLFFSVLFLQSVNAQDILKGVIRDGRGLPIEGASVKIKNSASFAIADNNGKFEIKTSKSVPFILEITSAGFSPAEVEVKELKGSELSIVLLESNQNQLNELVITSRRRIETAQDVPIPISVIGGKRVEETGAFNVNRLKELVPSVQLYSSNPRNTTLNIRGQGSTFGLTNDGIDPGVGFYVDGVYYARPAATALDFVDIDQVEVLRGPQGTLFGKNTTAGAFNITTRSPKFAPGATFELSYGNYGFIQAKSSFTGAISKKLAARISFSGTQRDGVLKNVATNQPVNDINNIG
ncbi:MAG: TonB-dependent receptor, partial [Ferruginibacter sp.]|nr:TonB-dependent receptor [Ferruginibacter sp.]